MAPADTTLSPLETAVMQVIWRRGPSTAEEIRRALADERQLTDSTVRTLLRRVESKGFLAHDTVGRTFVYRALVPAAAAASMEVRSIVERLCGGSVESLLLGMVDQEMVTAEHLERLKARIGEAEIDDEGGGDD